MRLYSLCLILVTGANLMGVNGGNDQPTQRLGSVISPTISLDETRLLIVDGTGVILWDTETGKAIQQFQGHAERVRAVTFGPNRKFVLTGGGRENDLASRSTDNSARLWDMATGKEIRLFKGHESYVHTVQFSPDGKRILTSSRDSTARLWDAATGKELLAFSDVSYLPPAAKLSPDGRIVLAVTSGGHKVTLWDSQSGNILSILEKGKALFETAELDAKSVIVLTASVDGVARTWNARTGQELHVFAGHTSSLRNARFTPDGRKIVTASTDGTVRLWDASNGNEIKQFKHEGPVDEILLSGDGKRVFVKWHIDLDNNPLVRRVGGTLWNMESGQKVLDKSDIVAFSSDGKKFLDNDSLLDLQRGRPATWWDSETGKVIRRNNQ